MRVISVNTNGIRAAAKKGFYEWLKKIDADIVCIQETKAQEDQLTHEQFKPDDYFCHYHDAVKKALEKDGWIITDEPLTLSVSVYTTGVTGLYY